MGYIEPSQSSHSLLYLLICRLVECPLIALSSLKRVGVTGVYYIEEPKIF